MRHRISVPFALSMLLLTASAAEGQQLFSNFPVNGQISAFQVSGSYSVSNSFTLSAGATIGEIEFGAWLTTGDSVTGVAWSIGTTPFGATSGSGVAGATSSYNLSNADGYDVDTVSFVIPGLTLPAGTYYLTLSAAVSAGAHPVYWDINDGAGVDASDSAYGHVSASNTCFQTIGISGTCASSFEILSTNTAVTASPASLTFPSQTVNTTSTAQGITITNNGPGVATINGVAVTGANPGDFAQTNNCPISPATLAANGFCTIAVTFTPLAANARSAAVIVTGSSPQSIGLSGTGTLVPSTVTLLPTSIGFANQTVGTTSGSQGITITNSGPSPLTITSIAVTGTNPGDFAQTNNCPLSPATIAVNGFCTVNVTFTPLAANPRSAAITITDNGSGSPQSVGLSGTGIANTGPPAWPNGYSYLATFTVAAGQVPSAQSNFPALISGTYADFATTANGGRINNTCTQTVGNNATSVPCDLIFTSDAAGTVLLNWEFETYAAATGAVNLWVNAPNLSNGTVIYAWYGQPSVATLQTTPSGTWSGNFMAVYHLKENPAGTAPQMNDSTANGNHVTMNGTVLASQQQPGEIDGSVNFEGNTWASLANPANFSFERTDSFSLSGWFKAASNSSGTLLSKFVNGSAGWGLLQFSGSSTPVFSLGLFGSGESTLALAETPGVTAGAWHHVVATYSGTGTVAGMNIYVDGVNQTLTTLGNNLSTSILNTATPAINGRGGPSQMSTDSMDEIRVSTKGVVFTPAYVTASFNNQSKPGTFFTAVTGLTSSPSLSPSPSTIGFPNQTVNTTSASQPVTLTNNGPGAATISSIGITGTNPGDFAQTNNCPLSPATLAVSAFCTINVTFTPTAANARSAAITITDNGVGSPQSVGLSGTGLPVPSTVTLAPTSISFPNQTVNTTSSAQGITLTNSGPSPLTIGSIAVSGTNPGDFAQTNNCPLSPATIAVNGFCTINVTFTPLAANARSAAITITDNGVGSPQSVGLSGTGTAVVFQPWPNGYNYQATFTVAAGQVPSAQTNFPALISGTYADFATTTSGGRINNTCTQTVGNNATTVPCDLIFTSDAAGTVLLNWEFETYAAATGAVNIWVNAPNLSNGTVIYAWYGQPSVTTLQTTPSGTWSGNFMAVYHLKENPAATAPQMNDSTSNGNNATMNGTVLASQQQPGEIDGSVNFEGNTWASLANPANFSFERTDSFSISGWFNIASNSAGTLLSKYPNLGAGWAVMQFSGSSRPSFALGLFGAGSSTFALAETPAVTTGAWHYVVATYSGTGTVAGMNIYVDGANQTLTTLGNNLSTSILNTGTPAINGRAGPTQMSTDSMDEIRVSTKGVLFTPAYVTASFNNQSKPGTFFTAVTGLTNP